MEKTVSLEEVRRVIADYMWSEGCSCCQNVEDHDREKLELAKLLKVEPYSDGSGADFSIYRTKKD